MAEGKPIRKYKKCVIKMKISNEPRNLLTYFGGKTYMVNDIIFEVGRVIRRCDFFVDVFGGSGRVAISLPNEWRVKLIYNDIDKRIYSIIKWFQTEDAKLFLKSPAVISHIDIWKEIRDKPEEERTPLENFYLFFHSINGAGDYFKRKSNRSFNLNTKKYSRLLCENMDFQDLIKLYDSENTFFYLDPPYLKTQKYKIKFTVEDFLKLKEIIDKIKGFWFLNHIENDEISRIFGSPKCYKEYRNTANIAGRRKIRKESFWMNF